MSARGGLALALWLAPCLVGAQQAGTEAAGDDTAEVTRVEAALAGTAGIDDARLVAADADPANWLSYGRTYSEQRYSPLDQIDEKTVGQLGLAWSLDLGTHRGVEATPLVVDGVIYGSGPWSHVYAIDARTGQLLWEWDPKVPKQYGRIACCDVVNRGVALYRGKLYVGTLDGRLAALDTATGRPIWEVVTVDQSRAYTITGAPRIVQGKVIIGNGGAEYGVRGYVSAYDAETGEMAWRTYTVPGNPSKPFESEALRVAAETWTGDEWWKVGGGGTAWDSMAYDPELDLLYVGTGNGSPWSRYVRSPDGGDNLYVCSILALRPATGELVWYFQTTPGDNWDYTSTQHIMLADLEIDGKPRKVLMQAPKNGFFYVIDRVTGAFISAKPYVEVTWATGIDASGRPIEAEGNDYREEQVEIKPSTLGGHNWHPMSYNPNTGLVYIPAQELAWVHRLDKEWKYDRSGWNTATDFSVGTDLTEEELTRVSGHLIAWDPVRQAEVWRVDYRSAWNGGTLSTGGNLVFQGTADGRFVAYRASDGKKLWEAPAGTGVIAAPSTYTVDGEQYVTVMAGWGGIYALALGPAARLANVVSVGRVLTFKLGGTASLPPTARPPAEPPVLAVAVTADAADLKRGGDLFHRECAVCHGFHAVGGGAVADLRYATPETHARFIDIVLGGIFLQQGMPSFADRLQETQVRLIEQYILSRAAAASRKPASAQDLPPE